MRTPLRCRVRFGIRKLAYFRQLCLNRFFGCDFEELRAILIKPTFLAASFTSEGMLATLSARSTVLRFATCVLPLMANLRAASEMPPFGRPRRFFLNILVRDWLIGLRQPDPFSHVFIVLQWRQLGSM